MEKKPQQLPSALTPEGKALLQQLSTHHLSPPAPRPEGTLSLSLSQITAFVLARKTPQWTESVLCRSAFLGRTALRIDPQGLLLLKRLPPDKFVIIPICSYTYKRYIEIPVRGKHCDHHDVVDLEYIMEMHKRTGYTVVIRTEVENGSARYVAGRWT